MEIVTASSKVKLSQLPVRVPSEKEHVGKNTGGRIRRTIKKKGDPTINKGLPNITKRGIK